MSIGHVATLIADTAIALELAIPFVAHFGLEEWQEHRAGRISRTRFRFGLAVLAIVGAVMGWLYAILMWWGGAPTVWFFLVLMSWFVGPHFVESIRRVWRELKSRSPTDDSVAPV